MKRLISLLTALALAAALAVPAAAVESAEAGTMRLESAEGAVAVKNASGLDVKLKDKMRLYDGYSVKTEAASYAYVSLDGTKTLKLDASSQASVSKSGKKLEVTLVSGSMFFNVSKPLESSESLTIRTSTTVTGVRGTAGYVDTPDRNHTEITLLTGRLEVTGRDSNSGQTETVEMVAGEHIIVTREEPGTPQEHMEIQKISVQEAEVPGFAAVAVAGDLELQSRITAETALSVPLIIGDAEERLAADESAARQEAAEIQQRLEQQEQARPHRQAVDPVFKPAQNDPGTGREPSDWDDDDSGGSAPAPGTPTEPDPAPGTPANPATTIDLTNPTLGELQEALNSSASVINLYLESTPTIANPLLEITGTLDVPRDKTLNLRSGVLENESDISIYGVVNVYSGTTMGNGISKNITVWGTLNVLTGGILHNSGNLNIFSASSLHVAGSLDNFGAVLIGSMNGQGFAEISGGLLSDGAFTVNEGSTLQITGKDLAVSTPIELRPGATVSLDESTGWALWQADAAEQQLPFSYTNDGTAPVYVELRISETAKTHTVTFLKGDGHYTVSSDTNDTMVETDDGSGWAFTVLDGANLTFTLMIESGYTKTIISCAPPDKVSLSRIDEEWTLEGPQSNPSAGITSDATIGVETAKTCTVTFPCQTGDEFFQSFTVFPADTVEYQQSDGKCVCTVRQDEDFRFSLEPGEGYDITSVDFGGAQLTPDGSGKYTIPSSSLSDEQTVTVTARRSCTVSFLGSPFGYSVNAVEIMTGSDKVHAGEYVKVTLTRDTGLDGNPAYRNELSLENLKLYVNGQEVTGLTPAGDADTKVYAFPVDPYLTDGTTRLYVSLEGVKWAFKNSAEAATSAELDGIFRDSAVANVDVSYFDNAGGLTHALTVHNGQTLTLSDNCVIPVKSSLTVQINGALTCGGNTRIAADEGYRVNIAGALNINGALTVTGQAGICGSFTMGTGSTLNVGNPSDSAAGELIIDSSGPFDTENGTITLYGNSTIHVAEATGLQPCYGYPASPIEPDVNGDYTYTNTGGGPVTIELPSGGTYTVSCDDSKAFGYSMSVDKTSVSAGDEITLTLKRDTIDVGTPAAVYNNDKLNFDALAPLINGNPVTLTSSTESADNITYTYKFNADASLAGASNTLAVTAKGIAWDLNSHSDSSYLAAALDDPAVTKVKFGNWGSTPYSISGGKTVHSGQTLLLYDATIPIYDGVTVESGGTLEVDSGANIELTSTTGKLMIESDGELRLMDNGKITNNGTLNINAGKLRNDGALTISNSGTLTNNGGKLDIGSGGILTVTGTGGRLVNQGTLNNGGTLTLSSSGILENHSELNNNNSLTIKDSGSRLTVNSNGTLTSSGAMSIQNSGVLEVGSGGTLDNKGDLTINTDGTLTVQYGKLENSGTLTVYGTLTGDADSELYDKGTLNIGDGTSSSKVVFDGKVHFGSDTHIDIKARGLLRLGSDNVDNNFGGTNITDKGVMLGDQAQLCVRTGLPVMPAFTTAFVSNPGLDIYTGSGFVAIDFSS